MKWTKEQRKVIDVRNKNILVSAAAGSGKTAVLVERIISMITDEKQPIDIDRLLIVTFTNAAAAQMREKIGKAIEEKLRLNPDNLHLQKQMTLLPSSHITTIHSFCLNVIRNYFHVIDLDPSFKLAEESEATLMKSDVIAELLEQYYEEGREDFHELIESYSFSKSDAPIEDLILQLYSFSMSYPWPKVWLKEKQKAFHLTSLEELNQMKWLNELLQYIQGVIDDLCNKNKTALELCNEVDGPGAYTNALVSDRSLLMKLKEGNTYDELACLLAELSFERLSSKKEEGVSPWKKDRVKGIREEIKQALKDLNNQFFFQSPQEMLRDMQSVDRVMKVLFELAEAFMEAFAKKKEEKNLIDFNDLEHFALKILVQEQEGAMAPSLAAIELSEYFVEILVDEYQDSNLVQETILKSISKERLGQPNRFMVGDVKQSIYKFRLAMPELFMEKYNSYPLSDTDDQGNLFHNQRIDLDRNFRSRAVVLECVNRIFKQIMMKAVGDIDYNEEASLKPGGSFDGTKEELSEAAVEILQKRIAKDAELILISEEDIEQGQGSDEREAISSDMDFEEQVYTKKEIEARAIARKIKELVDPQTGMLVYDKDNLTHKPASYRDIVILLRSMSNWSEVFVNALMQEGIPAYADTSTGYFQTVEIITILNLLRIIDNPRQDIPLVGVLYSPMVGLTTNELAIVRAAHKSESMYNAINAYAQAEGVDEIKVKLHGFLKQLEDFRGRVNHTSIHEMLQYILDETGYYYYATAMPAGDRRKANIDLLISHAIRFEKGSYSGLFHFIRYIEKLQKYDVDFGEAVTVGEQDNTVRIMSIHKSKGLEFPIVFVAGLGKQFNTQDLRSKLVLHAEYGVGPEYIDVENRTKVPTLIKKAIQKKVQIENLGEELRVLYVALTRAKEKLIMTGYLSSGEDIQKKTFTFYEIVTAKSYLDWVLPAMLNQVEEISNRMVGEGISITVYNQKEFIYEELGKQVFQAKDQDELLSIPTDMVIDTEIKAEIKKRFHFVYPYEKDAGLRVKMSVSELKKMGQFIDEEQSEILYTKPMETVNQELDGDTIIPNFIKQTKEITGTDRGSLYHKLLELLDLERIQSKEDMENEIQNILSRKQIKEEDLKRLNKKHILSFVQSDIANRMRRASFNNLLYKEKQFVIGIKASEIKSEYQSDELVLIQGIIDAFFEEEGELVIVDYKSDLVGNKGEELLVKRYKVQLDYYQRALEQITGKRVKEKIIYSLNLGKEIRID